MRSDGVVNIGATQSCGRGSDLRTGPDIVRIASATKSQKDTIGVFKQPGHMDPNGTERKDGIGPGALMLGGPLISHN